MRWTVIAAWSFFLIVWLALTWAIWQMIFLGPRLALSWAISPVVIGTVVEFVHGLVALSLAIVGVLWMAGIYFLPALIAKHRSHDNTTAIMALNVFLGWTAIGWVAALVWALTKPSSHTAVLQSHPA